MYVLIFKLICICIEKLNVYYTTFIIQYVPYNWVLYRCSVNIFEDSLQIDKICMILIYLKHLRIFQR